MNDIIKFGVILCLITAFAGASLGGVYTLTKPKIEEQKKIAEEEARKHALPDAAYYETIKVDDFEFYKGYADENKKDLVGYLFVAKGKGYSSEVQTMVGVKEDFTINNIKVMSQQETPGLGAQLEALNDNIPDKFLQFQGRNMEQLLLDKDGGEMVTITGATISSRTITYSIRDGITELNEILSTIPKEIKEVNVSDTSTTIIDTVNAPPAP